MSMNSFHARKPRPAPAAGSGAKPKGAPPAGFARADALVVARGLAASRTAAQRAIEAQRVRWLGSQGWEPVQKPAQLLPEAAELELAAGEEERYVSRGGVKLAGALARTDLAVQGCIALDVGQSTGGFTDCLLQAGAWKVVGVDVGHGQLHPRLQQDPRVVALEDINARELAAARLGDHLPPGGFPLIVADLSFISLTLVLPRLPALLAPGGHILVLVKPQFEVGREGINKHGLVKDPALYQQVEEKIRACAEDLQLQVRDWFDSPIAGGDGNREFFAHLISRVST